MPRFSIRNPYFIVVACLIILVIGISTIMRMPIDLFPKINLPQVVVATFYSGMPPEDIETEITGRFERWFTLGAGIDHMESRSLPGVSIIKIFFHPETNADSDVDEISNLAMADLRRLPPGTLPPVVMKFDSSSLPVCLITLHGQGMTETQLRDLGQFQIRNQLATAPGASVVPPFGGKYRQIMVYVDPTKLQSHGLSVMDVVKSLNSANLILPAGDAKIGPYDYNIYTNSQISSVDEVNNVPIKTINQSSVMVGDIGSAKDSSTIQTNIVRVDGQKSVYLPIMKQGGDTNTIAVVDAVKDIVSHLRDVPGQLKKDVVFDQSEYVKKAIETLLHEGTLGLLLTAFMVLVFLGSLRATSAVFLSIPISALAALIALDFGGSSINTMVLAGLAIVFSRLIDNSVIVLENIYRHLELGEAPEVAAEKGGQEVSMAVLAATITSAVVFFPVTFLYGVSKFLFSALALTVVLALFASYIVALTVVPLYCARLIKAPHRVVEILAADHEKTTADVPPKNGLGARFNAAFHAGFERLLDVYERAVRKSLRRPVTVIAGISAVFLLSLCFFPLLGEAFFPRTDAGQFVINVKLPSGTRIETSNQEVAKIEGIVRQVVSPHDLRLIVSNLGVIPDYSAIYTTNSGPHMAVVQVALNDDHKISSFEYMDRLRKVLGSEMPEVSTFFQSGGIQDSVLNQGLPAPIDIQISGSNLESDNKVALQLEDKIRKLPGVNEVYMPQDLDYPALRLDVDRLRASELGLNQKEVIDNVITALTSNGMIAPSFWVDPKTGNDYMLTVQYPEKKIKSVMDLKTIPLLSSQNPVLLDSVSKITRVESPTEVDHYQIQRVIDLYVTPTGESLGKIANSVDQVISEMKIPESVHVDLRGMVQGMRASFHSFGLGLSLALVLLFLVLVAQFRSFMDPLLILLAVPTGIAGVIFMLYLSHTTLNVQSLMGLVMMVGIVVSNSILIVEFAHRLQEGAMSPFDAVVVACRVRLRPILMTSLATVFGLIPMALKLSTGSEVYAPLARAIIGGLILSVALTVFIVPAAYVLVYGRTNASKESMIKPEEI